MFPPLPFPTWRKRRNAWLRISVVVHGETLVEPVEPGTNRAAVSCPEVDILAHPGCLPKRRRNLPPKTVFFLSFRPAADMPTPMGMWRRWPGNPGGIDYQFG